MSKQTKKCATNPVVDEAIDNLLRITRSEHLAGRDVGYSLIVARVLPTGVVLNVTGSIDPEIFERVAEVMQLRAEGVKADFSKCERIGLPQ